MSISTIYLSSCISKGMALARAVAGCGSACWRVAVVNRSLLTSTRPVLPVPPSRRVLQHPPVWVTSQAAESGTTASTSETSSSSQSTAPKPKKYNLRSLTKDDVEFTFARSSGAGGQNVNKVNTKVDMRFDLDKHPWIPDEVKEEIRRVEKNRFTKDGVLVITSQRHRTQAQNIDDALDKLQAVLDAAVEAVTPKEADPETIKRVKANIKAGQEKRLQEKKKESMRKKERSRRDWD